MFLLTLRKHWCSAAHKGSVERYQNYKIGETLGTITERMIAGNSRIIEQNNHYAEKIVSIVLFLAKQGIAFRGHNESCTNDNRGYFLELFELFGKFDLKPNSTLLSTLY